MGTLRNIRGPLGAAVGAMALCALLVTGAASASRLSAASEGKIAAEIVCSAVYAHRSKTPPFTYKGPLRPEAATHCGLGSPAFWRKVHQPGYKGFKISTVNRAYVLVSYSGVNAKGEPDSDEAGAVVEVPKRRVLATWETLGPCPPSTAGPRDGDAAVPAPILKGFGLPRCTRTAR